MISIICPQLTFAHFQLLYPTNFLQTELTSVPETRHIHSYIHPFLMPSIRPVWLPFPHSNAPYSSRRSSSACSSDMFYCSILAQSNCSTFWFLVFMFGPIHITKPCNASCFNAMHCYYIYYADMFWASSMFLTCSRNWGYTNEQKEANFCFQGEYIPACGDQQIIIKE